ncbi:hypothetical protein [Micromonospora sp. NPDC023814]|uniref:hypothetical protein n=1 Tax=Micromonospora sp. NPDC023814 TaxID=3154596 RepID=UPI0033E6310C
MTVGAVVDQAALGDHVCGADDDETYALAAVGRFVAPGLRHRRAAADSLDTSGSSPVGRAA